MQDSKVRQARKARQRKAARAAGLKAAPGELATLQAFVNTMPRGRRPDQLADAAAVANWLARHGLIAAGTALDDSQWRRAHDLRDGLRDLVFSKDRGRKVDGRTLGRIERAVGGGSCALRYDDDGPIGFVPAAGEFDDALATLAAIVAGARREGSWRYVKLCARGDCGRLFFDASANRTGRWCSPQCGDQVRTAAQRRRRRGR